MHGQVRHGDGRQLRPEIGGGDGTVALQQGHQRGLQGHSGDPALHLRRGFRVHEGVDVVAEPFREVAQQLFRPERFEQRRIDAVGVVVRPRHQRRDRSDHHDPGDSPGTVPGQVTHDFPRRHRMADQRHLPQIQPVDQRGDVVRRPVEAVAAGRFVRPAMAAAVEGDAAASLFGQRTRQVMTHTNVPAARACLPSLPHCGTRARDPVKVHTPYLCRHRCRSDPPCA